MNKKEIKKTIDNYLNTKNLNISVIDNITNIEKIEEHLKKIGTDMFNAQFLDIKGAVFENKIFIFSDFIHNEEELIETINHEIAGHYTFSKLFNENQKKNILTKIFIDLNDIDKKNIQQLYKNQDNKVLAEEFLCFSIENMNSNTDYPFLNSILKKNIDYFKQNFLKNNKHKKELRI